MAYDPTQSYVINTSALPVYVLPPEQYTQINQQQFVQPYPDQQAVYTQPMPYGQSPYVQAPYGQPAYVQVGQPVAQQPFYAQPTYTQQPPVQTIAAASTNNFNTTKAARIEQSLLARGDQVPGICDCINAAFRLFGKHCGGYLLWILLTSALVAACICGNIFNSGPYGNPTLMALGNVSFNFFLLALTQGFYWATIQASRSESAEMKARDFITPLRLPFLLKLIVLNLIMAFIIAFGFLLLIIPGVYFGVCYMFCGFLLHEYEPHGLGINQCMNISKAVVNKNWCYWFGFAIVVGLFSLVPFCTPIAMIAMVLAFRDTFGLIEQHDVGDLSVAL